jgi:hypothetical protein
MKEAVRGAKNKTTLTPLINLNSYMKVYKLKPNKRNELLNWGKQLMSIYYQEALKAISEENCSREFGFAFSIGNDDYAVLHMEGGTILPPTDRNLNKRHKEILKDCIDHKLELTEIYDLVAELKSGIQ